MNKFEEKIAEQVKKRGKDIVLSKGEHTIGEFVEAVLSVDNERDAWKFYLGYLNYIEKYSHVLKPSLFQPAESIARSNIGWCFGEGMSQEQVTMWVKVCKASHPVFGAMIPTAEEAFKAGLKAGKKLRR